MFNTLRQSFQNVQERVAPAGSFLKKVAAPFRKAYTTVTSSVRSSMEQPTMIPYEPKVVSESAPYFQEMVQKVGDTIKKAIHNNIYNGVHVMQDFIDHTSKELRSMQDRTSAKYQGALAIKARAQQGMREVLGQQLDLQDSMERSEMEQALKVKGYQRMRRGDMGYASVINTLDESDRQHLEADGGIWVCASVWQAAQIPLNYKGVKEAAWDAVDAGISPMFHLPRLMQVLGYEDVPQQQLTFTFEKGQASRSPQAFQYA